MSERLKHALVLLGLVALVVIGAMWGAVALVKPFPPLNPKDKSSEAPVCTDHEVAKGTRVRPSMVTVSAWNASDRTGLASSTMEELITQGFVKGEAGNAPTGTTVQAAEIWTGDTTGPAAALVRTWLGPRTPIVSHPDLGTKVVVVVGRDYHGLGAGRPYVVAKADALVCGPKAG